MGSNVNTTSQRLVEQSSNPPTSSTRPSPPSTPRSLSKEEAKHYRQLGISILKVIHTTQKIITVRYDERFPVTHQCAKRVRGKEWGNGKMGKRGERDGMSTLAEVSETATVTAMAKATVRA